MNYIKLLSTSGQPGKQFWFYQLPPDRQRRVLQALSRDPDTPAPVWRRDMMDARALATHMTGGPE